MEGVVELIRSERLYPGVPYAYAATAPAGTRFIFLAGSCPLRRTAPPRRSATTRDKRFRRWPTFGPRSQTSQHDREGARPAADIEKAPGSVQPELVGQPVG
jgi:hypothetical protein